MIEFGSLSSGTDEMNYLKKTPLELALKTKKDPTFTIGP
ncbi:hypothetical protein LAC1533_1963 [Ligilactobacillus acidipiscis]|uniref:Uncharacterized protein n=1 Tax=Ligilactobacillus acidipiscis TaxID=89059 RepID=A0A1K1KR75_9LACO|nr:hypothetical protein LAC1533_1963 [Ligilactobacillus acidipiscis]